MRRPRGSRGFTLLELIVVAGILAIVAGMSLAFLGRVGRSLEVTAFRGQATATIRAARNAAVTANGPVVVRVDAAEGEIFAQVRKTVGMWHFEAGREEQGAYGLSLVFRGAVETVPGKVGSAIRLGKAAYGDAGALETFDFTEGGAIEAWVFPEGTGGGAVVSKGKAFRLSVDSSGLVRGEFGLGGRESVEAKHPIPTGRWSHLELVCDGETLALLVNGAEVATWRPKQTDERLVPSRDPSAPLRVGDSTRGFGGRVDGVRVSDILRQEIHRAPPNVRIVPEGTTTDRIVFTSTGALDPRYHVRPEVITLESKGTGKREVIEIGLMGDVR